MEFTAFSLQEHPERAIRDLLTVPILSVFLVLLFHITFDSLGWTDKGLGLHLCYYNFAC